MNNKNMNTNKTDKIDNNIAYKIKELSAVKQTYLLFIIQLFDLLKDNVLKEYAIPLIQLLQKIINIQNDTILLELEDALSSVLITYMAELNDLLNGKLDLFKYVSKHNNLISIHIYIDHLLVNYDQYTMLILKYELFLI
jgi:hypothetical protein